MTCYPDTALDRIRQRNWDPTKSLYTISKVIHRLRKRDVSHMLCQVHAEFFPIPLVQKVNEELRRMEKKV